MAEYRIYVIGSDGHIVSARPLICDDDEQAIERANADLAGQPVEIWSGDRFVIRLYADR
ncbi:MAG: hypothetical protein PS018_07685 [bacterium]|nr:hypothetical protein [bacterium]